MIPFEYEIAPSSEGGALVIEVNQQLRKRVPALPQFPEGTMSVMSVRHL